jgi:hypothetical protein
MRVGGGGGGGGRGRVPVLALALVLVVQCAVWGASAQRVSGAYVRTACGTSGTCSCSVFAPIMNVTFAGATMTMSNTTTYSGAASGTERMASVNIPVDALDCSGLYVRGTVYLECYADCGNPQTQGVVVMYQSMTSAASTRAALRGSVGAAALLLLALGALLV